MIDAAQDLEKRVMFRKLELISEIIEHKKNSSRGGAAAEIERIAAQLSELAAIVKQSVANGWANVNPAGRGQLVRWLER